MKSQSTFVRKLRCTSEHELIRTMATKIKFDDRYKTTYSSLLHNYALAAIHHASLLWLWCFRCRESWLNSWITFHVNQSTTYFVRIPCALQRYKFCRNFTRFQSRKKYKNAKCNLPNTDTQCTMHIHGNIAIHLKYLNNLFSVNCSNFKTDIPYIYITHSVVFLLQFSMPRYLWMYNILRNWRETKMSICEINLCVYSPVAADIHGYTHKKLCLSVSIWEIISCFYRINAIISWIDKRNKKHYRYPYYYA